VSWHCLGVVLALSWLVLVLILKYQANGISYLSFPTLAPESDTSPAGRFCRYRRYCTYPGGDRGRGPVAKPLENLFIQSTLSKISVSGLSISMTFSERYSTDCNAMGMTISGVYVSFQIERPEGGFALRTSIVCSN
jgi:hypothetical protein